MVKSLTSSRRVRTDNRWPKWTVSRVLSRKRLSPFAVRIIHLGDTLPCRSSTLPGYPRSARADLLGRVILYGIPIRVCSGKGLPRRRSPGCRAWALTPRFQPYLCSVGAKHQPLPKALASRQIQAIGGVISVALSLGSPRVAVNDFPTLRSPDFPPADDQGPPAILRPPPTGGNVTHASGPRNAFAARVFEREIVVGRVAPGASQLQLRVRGASVVSQVSLEREIAKYGSRISQPGGGVEFAQARQEEQAIPVPALR